MNKGQPSRATNAASKAEVTPVLDVMPIQFSHKVIMSCIEEIKLRGLRQPQLFRNAFHAPSVEAALSTLANPHKRHLFSVKMMRIDTVAGLLTTSLSRTYPPLIPLHIQEMFQNPNGRFFFELLGMLPELNRYLFVEILDLCCALVDQQKYNQISHSKLAVFPGSCCFGLNEYKPNWDTRYLMSADLKKVSSAFYHAIYAYRDERDLTQEDLQHKLDMRARRQEQDRIAALERQHGVRAAHAILRMEARIAQGLPAESPMKEISLYADRREKVVADDAISVLDIQLDDDDCDAARVPDLDCVDEEEEEEEENVHLVMKDLRRSVSVASLGRSLYENQPRPLPPSAATRPTSPIASGNGLLSPTSPRSPLAGASLLSRSNTLARSVSLKLHPVSPGDIFGISQRAVEKRELEAFLAVARTVKPRRTGSRKRFMHQRQVRKMRTLIRQDACQTENPTTFVSTISTKRVWTIRRNQRSHLLQAANVQPTRALAVPRATTVSAFRRERAKKTREELEVYQANGLGLEEAIQARDGDLKRQKRKERRAKLAALAEAEAEREAAAAAAAAAVAGAIAQNGLLASESGELTVEEAEILEAFDYLTDEEFQEFMELAGLSSEDVESLQAKAAALSLTKVTHEIEDIQVAESELVLQTSMAIISDEDSADAPGAMHRQSFDDGEDMVEPPMTVSGPSERHEEHHPASQLRHMTSMDMLFKHASVVGDANLRLYPTRPSSPTISDYESDSMHGGLLSRAASVMRTYTRDDEDDVCDDEDDEETMYEPSVRHSLVSAFPFPSRSLLAAKTVPQFLAAPTLGPKAQEQQELVLTVPQQQINNHQHQVQAQTMATLVAAAEAKTYEAVPERPAVNRAFEFETIVDYEIDEEEEDEGPIALLVVEETEEEAELRELLESMSEEERSEFLRLSNQEGMASLMGPGVVVQH
ncbi:hypothetical protein KVV02_000812 [Mortierella alpina]|uniref:Rho-GAP domain-containing protein n=1 Tax=Mortierella alpina TaxID=64518 RepID=A0A9P8A4V3_MORAP|nr:hypothetical protein KVV02_000812 [Mortierella alpina]